MNNTQAGASGEKTAVDFIIKKGYTILETNWRTAKLEVDIIANHKNTIIFIEVKTRTGIAYGFPEKAVSAAKKKNLINAAAVYLEEKNLDAEIRFDIISIVLMNGKTEVYHIEDAFAG
ncbi:MAG: YraN family protein [Bacteroidetes bacterium]|nr:YraN family protein [Bacteroidota bacterium]